MRITNIIIAIVFLAGLVSVGYAFHEINEPIPDFRGDSYELELPTGQIIMVTRNRQ